MIVVCHIYSAVITDFMFTKAVIIELINHMNKIERGMLSTNCVCRNVNYLL